MKQTWLECIECGRKSDLLDERNFKCPNCGNLFDVNHDFNFLGMDANELLDLFDKRAKANPFYSEDPCVRSGVWRFKEWIMPFLPKEHIVTLEEGNVRIIKASPRLHKWIGGDIGIWIIQEGMSPTGSFKDFGGTVMMTIAKAGNIKLVIVASTGDTSAMAALYASVAGINCAVVLPRDYVTPVQMIQPLVHGATVITLPGKFDACMTAVRELVHAGRGFPANSINPTRIEGHQASVFLTAQFLKWSLPDYFVVPVGNGSNSSSVGKAIRLMNSFGFKKVPRILGCQSEAAKPLARSWLAVKEQKGKVTMADWQAEYRDMETGETTATAALIGKPVSRQKVMREIIYTDGLMEVAQEEDLNQAIFECGEAGPFVCPQTGTALAGLRNAVRKGEIAKGSLIFVISTATGMKFAEAAAKHSGQGKIVHASDCETETVAKILGI